MATERRRKLTCPICLHAERGWIERMRVAGTSGDILAEKFGVSRDSIYRHMNAHVPPELKAQIIADVPLSHLASVVADEGLSLLDHLKVVRNTSMSAMLAAASVNDHKETASGAKRSIEVLREIGRLTGELLNAAPVRSYVQNNITVNGAAMARLEAMLLDRLAPHPEALQAVLAGLRSLDEDQAAHDRCDPSRGLLCSLTSLTDRWPIGWLVHSASKLDQSSWRLLGIGRRGSFGRAEVLEKPGQGWAGFTNVP